MTWKEPLRVREFRFKRFRSLFPRQCLGCIVLLLIGEGLLLADPKGLAYSDPKVVTQGDLQFFWQIVRFVLPAMLIFMVIPVLVNCFEATYGVDDEGIHIQRTQIGNTIRWRGITHLEIVPHPILENISVIRIATRIRQNMIDPIPLETEASSPPTWWSTKNWEEIPFETGELDSGAILELYQKHGRKKRGLGETVSKMFKRPESEK